MPTADPAAIAAIVGGYHGAPFDVLGQHLVTVDGAPAISIRTYQPQAKAVSVHHGADQTAMQTVDDTGFYEAVFPGVKEFFPYRLAITLPDGATYELEDPYRFGPGLTEFGLDLLCEANNFE